MNKAITDGIVFMPPAFEDGLGVWSSQNGTPGSATYAGSSNAALVPADPEFGSCLELLKTDATQKLRYMGETPILPGCYLRVTARVKAISGNLPGVRIAAYPVDGSGAHVTGLTEAGPTVTLTSYGEVVTVTAILGTGTRGGVDMAWNPAVAGAHIGLDLTGATGGVVRIDDIEIEDATDVFYRKLMDWVDVRDYGAKGDGSTDDSAAFEAADAAAGGREVLVSAGSYYLANHVTFESQVRFEGTVSMPAGKRLTLTKNFDLPSYIDAFGDELDGFERALAALFNFSDHEGLDMKGRRVDLDQPVDVQAVVGNNKTTHSLRTVIRNGQFNALDSTSWNTQTVTSQASYSTSNPTQLTNVVNVANVPVGALVQGVGVGREVYVRAKNVGAGTLTLSRPLFDAVGTQSYTFKRFKYILDFSGFDTLSKFVLSDIEFQCNGRANGVLLAPGGIAFHVRDCFFTKPKDRGLSSPGRGCQGMLIDRCQFLSNEQAMRSQDRSTIALNSNANDVKLRDNRVVMFAHFAVMGGSGHIVSTNHWFQGDGESSGVRQAGLVLTATNVKTTVTGNYIDNNFIEWTNEHDAEPIQNNELSFGGLTITSNIFMASDTANWFRWIVVKPVGAGHFIHGLNISGNVFKSTINNIQRIDRVDSTYAGLDMSRARNIVVEGNAFNGVDQVISNPVTQQFDINTDSSVWTCDFAGVLPFGGRARLATAVVTENAIRNGAGSRVFSMPYAVTEQGTSGTAIALHWPEAVHGRVQVTARMDNPI